MKHTGVVIYVNAGAIPAEEYIKRALHENKSCIGAAALVTKTGEQPVFQVESFSQTVPLASLMGLLTNFKDCEVLLHLGNADTKVSKEDLQPFIALRDKEDKVIAVGAIDGMWYPTPRNKTNEDSTEEGLLIRDYLEPKLAKLYKLADNDIGGFFKELKAKDTEDDLKAKWDKHGSMVFLGINGEIGRVDHNASFRKFDWGFVTKHYNYKAEELKIDAPKPEPDVSSMFGMPIADSAPIQQPTKDTNKELKLGEAIPPIGNVKTELLTGTASAVKAEGKWIRPPLGMMGERNPMRKFYDRAVSHNKRPDNYMEGPAVWVTLERMAEKGIKAYREVEGPLVSTKGSVPAVPPKKEDAPAVVEPPKENKEQVTKIGDADPKDLKEQVHGGETKVKPPLSIAPIIPQENKMKITAKLLAMKSNTAKTVDNASNPTAMPPSKIQGVENNLPKFTEQLGIKREDLLFLSYPQLVELTREYPDEMAILTFNLLGSATAVGLKPKKEEPATPADFTGDNSHMFGQSMSA